MRNTVLKTTISKYRFIWLLSALVLTVAGCSTEKNTSQSRWWHSFNARYNTYYNGTLAYIEASLEKEKGNQDNFTEMIPMYSVGNKKSRELGKGNYDKAIEKCEKAIKLHSITRRPEWNKSRRKTEKDIEWLNRKEYNPFLWKAWMLMGRSQFYKGAFDEAASTFSYMSRIYATQPAIYGRARAWLAKCYVEQEWLYDAEEVIRNARRDAVEFYKKALSIDPTKTAGYKEVANLYRRLKNPAEGVAYYEKYIELLGEKADEADKLGLGVYLTNVKDAIPNKEDGSVDAEARLAVIKKADPYFEEYMNELPDKYQGPFYRAKLWIRDNQAAEDEPKMWYEKTLEIIGSLPADEAEKAVSYKKTALTYLMIYYLKTNDDATCKTYVDQILAIDPADKLANQVKSVLN